MSAGELRGYVRAGFLSPERGERGELLFSFQDLVFLRAAATWPGRYFACARLAGFRPLEADEAAAFGAREASGFFPRLALSASMRSTI